MAACFSVGTPTQPLACSQTSARSSSIKRPVGRGTHGGSSHQPRVSLGSSSLCEPSWVESWGQRTSVSSSVKRSVASSPTESKDTSKVDAVRSSPSTVVLGFDVPGAAVSGNGSLHLRPAKSGLLSKALEPSPTHASSRGKELPLLSPVFQRNSQQLFFDNSAYFPEVDQTLLEGAQERHDVFRTELLCNAFMIAGRAYRGQMRRDGSSVLSHCVLTALSLADFGLDAQTVAAGLLKEVLRNNEQFRSQLEEFMPTEVVQLVDRVNTIGEISEIYRCNREGMDDEKLRQMMLAMEDVKAVLVQLSARVHEMKAVKYLSPQEQQLLASETLDIYAVVANRLGCWCLKAELEDLAFMTLHPEQYEAVQAQVRSRQDSAALEQTIQTIKAALEERGIKYEDISGRPKNLYGIWTKMRADGVSTVDSIFDIIALRVVVSGNKHDCYFAQRAVQQMYRCMPERSKDFIKVIKKANGYQSLHETIYGENDMPIEVQIRTHKMHYIAEYGFAAHWKYKENLDNDDKWMDKEVQYKKWLMNYKLGMHDKKVRAKDAPPTDGSLKSLGVHYLDRSSDPEHQFKVDPFLMNDRFKLEQPSRRTVRVMLQTQDTVEQRECSANVTAGELARELDVSSLPGYVMTVNQRTSVDEDLLLRDGDLVQILPLSLVLSRSPPEKARGPLSSSLPVRSSSVPAPTSLLSALNRLPPRAVPAKPRQPAARQEVVAAAPGAPASPARAGSMPMGSHVPGSPLMPLASLDEASESPLLFPPSSWGKSVEGMLGGKRLQSSLTELQVFRLHADPITLSMASTPVPVAAAGP